MAMKRRDRYRLKLRFWLAGARNYAMGYAWSPVQRHRCCGHTTPFHAGDCGCEW